MLSSLRQWWKVRQCPHENIELIFVHPVTLAPQGGKCRQCGSKVKATTVWLTPSDYQKYKKAQRDMRVAVK